MHICHEEILAFFGAIPLISMWVPRVRAIIHARTRHCSHAPTQESSSKE